MILYIKYEKIINDIKYIFFIIQGKGRKNEFKI